MHCTIEVIYPCPAKLAPVCAGTGPANPRNPEKVAMTALDLLLGPRTAILVLHANLFNSMNSLGCSS